MRTVHKPESEPWGAAGPFVSMRRERGTVSIEALGMERFRVLVQGEVSADEIVIGYDQADARARELADHLGPTIT